ncbi:hypothetical protein NEOLEDRAFT_1173364 [Neolentinus lepideus HHB14362 ss-1]|uniref:SWIM-type domain-containing protein n=1 Tax=Neolentinus lepideus HHB14362 ss-1 TaxID=1314782 RepID=A0A165MUW9_9AGAM|nr:hypothetical protein NEOLEDRAFT_1173364 [Neolentinus lepideus HHB14362 ss-1]
MARLLTMANIQPNPDVLDLWRLSLHRIVLLAVISISCSHLVLAFADGWVVWRVSVGKPTFHILPMHPTTPKSSKPLSRPRKLYAKPELDKLAFDAAQQSAAGAIYEHGDSISQQYIPDSLTEQAHVRQFLMAHGLDRQSRQQLESRWNVQWSTRWQVAGDIWRRTLLQCLTARKAKVPMQIAEDKGTPSNARHNPYDFTGCLAHVEITECDSDGAVSRIMGYLCHNDECKSSVLKRIPAIPLHLHVYEVALEQLKSGARSTKQSSTTPKEQKLETDSSTEILAELLKIWKTHLSQGRAESFTLYVAITDTDVKERGALLQVSHSAMLDKPERSAIQRKTGRGTEKPHDPNPKASLLNSVDYEAAQKLIEDERSHFTALSKLGDPGAATAARVGAQYLDYLSATWMPKSLWQGWSLKARMVASTILGVPVESIITMTNHLESFNHVLKNKYIPQWQHSGAHLWFDFLIHILIIRILPEIFATRRHRQQYQNWVNLQFEKYAGGTNLSKVLQEERRVLQAIQKGSKACWWAADHQRDELAVAILRAGLLNGITRDVSEHQFEAVCYSTANPTSTPYQVTIHRIGYASCTCLDFVHRGGACKHLRALRIRLDAWVSSGHLPTFYYPGTPAAAKEIEEPLQPPALSEQGAMAAIINNLLVLQDMAGVEDPEDGIGPAMPGEAAVSEVDEQGEGSKPLSSRCNLSTEEAEQFQTVRRDWPFKSSSELNSS